MSVEFLFRCDVNSVMCNHTIPAKELATKPWHVVQRDGSITRMVHDNVATGKHCCDACLQQVQKFFDLFLYAETQTDLAPPLPTEPHGTGMMQQSAAQPVSWDDATECGIGPRYDQMPSQTLPEFEEGCAECRSELGSFVYDGAGTKRCSACAIRRNS